MKDLSIVVLRLALEGGWGCIGQSVVLVILCYGSWVGGDDFFSKFGFFVQQDFNFFINEGRGPKIAKPSYFQTFSYSLLIIFFINRGGREGGPEIAQPSYFHTFSFLLKNIFS